MKIQAKRKLNDSNCNVPPRNHFQKIEDLPCWQWAGEPTLDKLLQGGQPEITFEKSKHKWKKDGLFTNFSQNTGVWAKETVRRDKEDFAKTLSNKKRRGRRKRACNSKTINSFPSERPWEGNTSPHIIPFYLFEKKNLSTLTNITKKEMHYGAQ